MALDKFNWQNGSQVEPAKVEVEGVSYDVVDAQYEGETPLSASNLNLMQDTLLGNVVDDLEDESKIASCKAVKDVYSTDEVKTNKVWVNGKPIYRKVIYISSLPNKTSTAYNHLISNVDRIWCDKSNSYIIFSDDNIANFNYIGTTGSGNFQAIIEIRSINTTSFSINTYATDRRSAQAYVTLEYTKTTD